MTKWLNRLTIQQRINLSVALILTGIFAVLGWVLYNGQERSIQQQADERMSSQLNDLVHLLDLQLDDKQQNINSAIKLTKALFDKSIQIKESNDSLTIDALNQQTLQAQLIKFPVWLIDSSTQLQYNYDFVDQIRAAGIATATIFQRIPQGYLRISTNVKKDDGSRAINTYIPNLSPVAQAIDRGQSFYGRAYVVNDWYLTAYTPIVLDDSIKGMLYIGVKEKNLEFLQNLFTEKQYYTNGYPALLSAEGDLLLHPTQSGQTIKNTQLFRRIQAARKENRIIHLLYQWPENSLKPKWKHCWVKYYKPYDAYLFVTAYEDDLYKGITQLRITLLVGMVLAVTSIFLLLYMLIRPIVRWIKRLVKEISRLSAGEEAVPIDYPREDELGQIADSLNHLIEGLNETSHFANAIEQGDYDKEFTPLGDKDRLGNALLDMRQSLKQAREEQNKRAAEDERRTWIAQGLAEFANLLRQNNDDIRELAHQVIINLVNYLEMTLGALYIINDDESDAVRVEPLAIFAYDRVRRRQERMDIDEGLVGRCINQQASIYMTELPDNYLKIKSGLGEDKPQALLLTPLKVNDEVYGVLELAAFHRLKDHQIDFVERVSESIASTIASVKINLQTARLLDEANRKTIEMRESEETLRQNIEELRATQEESARREDELQKRMQQLAEMKKELAQKEEQQQKEIEELKAESRQQISEIRRTEKHSRQILESSLDGIVIIDQNGTIEFFNKAAETIWGYQATELIGQTINCLMPESHAKQHDTYIRHYIETGEKHIIGKGREVPILLKDGKMSWAFLTVIATRSGSQLKFTGFVKDLGKQKQLEEEHNSLVESIMAKEFKYKAMIERLEKTLEEHDIAIPEENENLLIIWGEQYELGIASIDQQHQKLVRLINTLYQALRAGEGYGYLSSLLDELSQYTLTHFNYEEKYMTAFNYDLTERHVQEHRYLVERVGAFKEKLDSGNLMIVYEMMNFMKEWLDTHIQQTDRQYVDWFIHKGLK